jgi:hypothetical protein
MKLHLCVSVFLVHSACTTIANAQYAASVVSYNAGATPSPGYPIAAAALGEPERITGEGIFPGDVTPFNPPWLTSEIVSVGEGGHLTLRLSNFVQTQTAGPHLGVFTNLGILDIDYPNGQAGDPVGTLSAIDAALVEVSKNGSVWHNLGSQTFDIPTNGFAAPNVPSDFLQPFTGSLADFNGLSYANMLTLLNGSGGGKWLDLSSSGLDQVGYVRFSVLDDSDVMTSLNFDLDGVAISRAAMGTRVPEPGLVAWGVIGCLLAGIGRRRLRNADHPEV